VQLHRLRTNLAPKNVDFLGAPGAYIQKAELNLEQMGGTCSAELRCPHARFKICLPDAGGAELLKVVDSMIRRVPPMYNFLY
jgi:hypothetical protein